MSLVKTDDANNLLSVGSTPTTVDRSYTYDNAGNVTSVANGTLVTSLNWDGANRLTGITYPGTGVPSSATNTFAYNGLDQRIGKADSTGTFPFTLADDAINSPVLSDGVATYQFGLGLESEVRGGSTRFYHPDIIGTTRTTSNASAAVSSTLETDAFGNTWTPGTSGVQSPFGFAGQYGYQSDADSGLMRVGYRYYDALSGRFISRDPIQSGTNWYTYCNNDPVNYTDPTGLHPPSERDLLFGDDTPRYSPIRDRVTSPPPGYINIGISVGDFGPVYVGGLIINGDGTIAWYGGKGIGTPGLGFWVTTNPFGHSSTGWSTSFSGGSLLGVSGSIDQNGSVSTEFGFTTPGISQAAIYTGTLYDPNYHK